MFLIPSLLASIYFPSLIRKFVKKVVLICRMCLFSFSKSNLWKAARSLFSHVKRRLKNFCLKIKEAPFTSNFILGWRSSVEPNTSRIQCGVLQPRDSKGFFINRIIILLENDFFFAKPNTLKASLLSLSSQVVLCAQRTSYYFSHISQTPDDDPACYKDVL